MFLPIPQNSEKDRRLDRAIVQDIACGYAQYVFSVFSPLPVPAPLPVHVPDNPSLFSGPKRRY